MKNSKQIIYAVLACFLYILCFWGITEASDLYSYTLMFEGKMDSRDMAFSYLAEIFTGRGLDFMALYKFHIVLIAISTVLMIRLFKVNALWVTILLVLANYVDMASQIRFFVALPLSIISLKLMCVDKSILFALLIAALSLLFHRTVLILYGAFFLIYLLRNKSLKSIISIGLISNLILFLLINQEIVSFDEQYDAYFEDRNITSVAGAFYSLLPLLVIIGMIVYTHSRIVRKRSCLLNNKIYIFLYILSITPLLLLLPSFIMQTIIRRFIITLFPIWIIYYIYIWSHFKSEYSKLHLASYLYATIALRMTWVWIMPLTGIVSSRYYEKLFDILINYKL